jgi:hypothetical protein
MHALTSSKVNIMTHKKEHTLSLAILTAGVFLTLQPAHAADVAVIVNAGTYTVNANDANGEPNVFSGILGDVTGAESPNGLAATAGLGARVSQPISEDMRIYGEAGVKQLEHSKQGYYLSAGLDKRVYTTASGDVEIAVGALVGARKSDVTGLEKTNPKIGLTATAESRNGFGVRATLYPTSEFGHAGTTGSGATTGILSGMNGGNTDGASVTLDFSFTFGRD